MSLTLRSDCSVARSSTIILQLLIALYFSSKLIFLMKSTCDSAGAPAPPSTAIWCYDEKLAFRS